MTQHAASLPDTPRHPGSKRFVLEVRHEPNQAESLARDVQAGLSQKPKSLPPKHFYDARGSQLFERICNTPEYYPTRTEQALLERHARAIVYKTRPSSIVELGSGSARKIATLLKAVESERQRCSYVPFDVSRSILEESGHQLMNEFTWLRVHAIVGDYDNDLESLPRFGTTLWMFLGGTIGNFSASQAVEFLQQVARNMRPGDRFLLGTDLVKATRVLNSAYNDSQGITAEFNKNVLRVINQQLGADFDLGSFEHVAFFDAAKQQIEMHLESTREQTVQIDRLGMHVHFAQGERLLTEISRKFTQGSVGRLLSQAGLRLESWLESPDGYFGLSLAQLA